MGLIVRYAVQEFDPSVNTITVTTSRVNNRDVASLSVSKNFLERILEFIEESISITGAIIPLGFPLCTLFNRHFAKIRAGSNHLEIKTNAVLNMIPKYVVIGDSQAIQMSNSESTLRPLVRDTIYHLIKARLKPKLITEDSYEEARKLGIRIGLIKRDHHKLAVIKSVDLLRNITDSRGDIKQGKVRYLLSRMKIMSQATPADKSLLIYLIKHCESMPNENLAYVGYSFTDPEAMRLADCSMTFQDCDDDDVKKSAQVLMKSETCSFTDIYLFIIICLIGSNITQSYALYQISASVACCIYRFLSITVFQEQVISHSQFTLLIIIQQVFAIFALMTKWLSSLPQAPFRPGAVALTELGPSSPGTGGPGGTHHHAAKHHHHHRSTTSISGNGSLNQARRTSSGSSSAGALALAAALNEAHPVDANHQVAIQMHPMKADDTLGSSSSLEGHLTPDEDAERARQRRKNRASSRTGTQSGDGLSMALTTPQPPGSRHSTPHKRRRNNSESHIHLSGTDLDLSVINSKLATTYKQTFHNSNLIDDVTYRLAKLHIAYQVLVMIIIMIFGKWNTFVSVPVRLSVWPTDINSSPVKYNHHNNNPGNAMFQLNMNNNRQHQTLAFNSLIMNNIFSLASCFNQFGEFNLRSGLRNHPFFVCVLLLSVGLQVCLTELNAFGLENLNPLQWFVCFVFALMGALIAPLTGQQRQRRPSSATNDHQQPPANPYLAQQQQQHQANKHHHNRAGKGSSPSKVRPKHQQ